MKTVLTFPNNHADVCLADGFAHKTVITLGMGIGNEASIQALITSNTALATLVAALQAQVATLQTTVDTEPVGVFTPLDTFNTAMDMLDTRLDAIEADALQLRQYVGVMYPRVLFTGNSNFNAYIELFTFTVEQPVGYAGMAVDFTDTRYQLSATAVVNGEFLGGNDFNVALTPTLSLTRYTDHIVASFNPGVGWGPVWQLNVNWTLTQTDFVPPPP